MQIQVNESHPGNIEMRGRVSIRVAVFLTAFLLPVFAVAQTDNWLGGAGNWNNGSMWSAGVPTSTASVFVDHGNAKVSAVTVSDGEQSGNLTIDSDDSVTLVGGLLNVFGPTISNAGTLAIANTTSQASLDINGAVTLTGAGVLSMSNNANNNIFGVYQNTGATLTNQSTIQGSGSIGPGCSNTFNNQHIVNANQSTPLYISICNGPSANTGTLEATNGGTLVLEGNAEGGGTFTNTGGTIHADASSTVVLYDSAIVKNGTLTTSGTGVIQCNGGNGACGLDGVTITSGSTHQVINGYENLSNTISNNGAFLLGNNTTSASLDLLGAVTLTGSGTLTMSNLANNQIFGFYQPSPGNTLTNQSTIQGSGSINPNTSNSFINQHIVNANQTTALNIYAGSATVTNTGTLEATNGGTLVLHGDSEGGGTFDNTGGTIQAGAGSFVVLHDSATVKNGNLASSSTGKTQCNGNNGACTLNGTTISGTHQVVAGYENLTNTVTNNGSFQMLGTSTNNVNMDILGSVVLAGSGTLKMGGPGNTIFGFYQPSPGNTLTNQSTIAGGGTINPSSGNNFINQHVVSATQNLTINGNFSNSGTLMVSKGKTLYISGGLFTNSSGSTLTGGKYMATGSLLFDGASIVNNAAGITLTGTTALIGNQSAVNALTGFSTNESTGSFTVTAGQQFATTLSGNFSNAGKVTAAKNSAFKVLCNPTFVCNYVQTAGTTTVDGVLTVALGNMSLQGGKLFGTGTVAASVNSKASVTAGDTATKAGTLSVNTYTQQSTGSLNVQIGGTTVGTQYSQLAVANGASLAGTLNIKLINGFVPAIGNTFTILTTSARTGTFATVNGLSINSSEHFQIAYNATNVTLTVVSGT
jgi:fibronectin-binding autotransporter adhesin